MLDRLDNRELEQVTLTKHGRPVAVVTLAWAERVPPEKIHGHMRGMTYIAPDLDLTEPILEKVPDAALGILHR